MGDAGFPVQQAQFALSFGGGQGRDPGDRLAGLGDDDLFALGRLFDLAGKMSLRLLDVDLWHRVRTRLNFVRLSVSHRPAGG